MPTESMMQVLAAPLRVFVSLESRLSLLYLMSAGVMAAFYFRRRKLGSTKVLLLQSGKMLLSPSGQLDICLLLLNASLAALILPGLAELSTSLSLLLAGALHRLAHATRALKGTLEIQEPLVALFYGGFLFLLDDASRYWLHKQLHRRPLLWRLHRTHHSAHLLTPLTFKRVHPLEMLLFSLRHMCCTGLLGGVFLFLFRGQVTTLTVGGISMGLILFNLLAANLRHSHLPLSWGTRVEMWLMSPAQHQQHHGRTPAQQNSNFGSVLAIWDRMEGSLLTANQGVPSRFGLLQAERKD